VLADIAESEGAEKGVAKCMDRNIAVRVRYAADRAFNLHASKP
jgi:hypothetical protein